MIESNVEFPAATHFGSGPLAGARVCRPRALDAGVPRHRRTSSRVCISDQSPPPPAKDQMNTYATPSFGRILVGAGVRRPSVNYSALSDPDTLRILINATSVVHPLTRDHETLQDLSSAHIHSNTACQKMHRRRYY